MYGERSHLFQKTVNVFGPLGEGRGVVEELGLETVDEEGRSAIDLLLTIDH